MEKFKLNSCGICSNPNRITGNIQKVRWTIMTAFLDGSWYYGLDIMTASDGWTFGVSKHREKCSSETEAKRIAAKKIIDWLNSSIELHKKYGHTYNIPDAVFDELKTAGFLQPVQLSLFS